VASNATSSTPCCLQKSANAAMPSALLANERPGPADSTKASREVELTSTPQMTRVTVTCLVRAIDGLATVRSCVTYRRRSQTLDFGFSPEGSRGAAAASEAPQPRASHSDILTCFCRLYLDTRDLSSCEVFAQQHTKP